MFKTQRLMSLSVNLKPALTLISLKQISKYFFFLLSVQSGQSNTIIFTVLQSVPVYRVKYCIVTTAYHPRSSQTPVAQWLLQQLTLLFRATFVVQLLFQTITMIYCYYNLHYYCKCCQYYYYFLRILAQSIPERCLSSGKMRFVKGPDQTLLQSSK